MVGSSILRQVLDLMEKLQTLALQGGSLEVQEGYTYISIGFDNKEKLERLLANVIEIMLQQPPPTVGIEEVNVKGRLVRLKLNIPI